jgi:hypothetical protein
MKAEVSEVRQADDSEARFVSTNLDYGYWPKMRCRKVPANFGQRDQDKQMLSRLTGFRLTKEAVAHLHSHAPEEGSRNGVDGSVCMIQ